MDDILKDIRKMAVFAVVAREGSFTRAAQTLGLGKSIVSEHVSQLESELGVQLLTRSTRKLSLTEAGGACLHHCEKVLEQAEAARNIVQSVQGSPRGRLRVSTTVDFGVLHLAPILKTFHRLYPDIQVDMIVDDAVQDLVAQQIDFAIRIGTPKDSALKYKRLGQTQLSLCASHAYLAEFGEPNTLADLIHHQWVAMTQYETPNRLRLMTKLGKSETVKLQAAFSSNSPMGAYALVNNDLGIGLLADILISKNPEEGSLKTLLSQYQSPMLEIYGLFAYSQRIPPKLRVFIDYLVEHFEAKKSI